MRAVIAAWVLAVIATPNCMEVMVIRFAIYMISENVQVFWSELHHGEFITDARGE